MKLIRTNADNKDFIELVKHLDADLAIRDGDDHAFYDQFNKIDSIHHVIVVYDNDKALGCGAIKQFDKNTMEIKRMFTLPQSRGKGIASKILEALENWASELSFEKCILETGIKQYEAIALYKKNGYQLMNNYGQYSGVKTSKCFQKTVK